MIEIPDGGYGKTRAGGKVGPLYHDRFLTLRNREMFYRGTKENEGGWYFHGRMTDDGSESPLDLIAEWTDGPVRTVMRTVTEVVAGSYGRVRVGRVVDVPDCNNPNVPPARLVSLAMDDYEYSATELKAAAAVLLELAGALSDGE